MQELEKRDIQGLIVRGYGTLRAARFLLLEVADAALARDYLQRIWPHVTTAQQSPDDHALHVAFTAPGLERLEVPSSARASFSREFLEGMDDDVRAASLGDEGANAPGGWTWGGPNTPRVHLLLMVYARNEDLLAERLASELLRWPPGAFVVLATKKTIRLPDDKEHFGWTDGLSTPLLEGLDGRKQSTWTEPAIRAGEFVLGYLNEYHCYSESPTVDPADDPDDTLPLAPDGALKDLGKNGTYLVYREMTQDVPRLWNYLETRSREPGADRVAAAVALGAKMVGRWPGGAPLVTSPDRDDPAQARENNFRYWDADEDRDDRKGTRCPLGAHIRRANPRNLLPSDHDAEDSTEMVRKHQLLRRGRAFGPPLAPTMAPRDFLAARGAPDPEPRGLHFICLVGHLGRQFEFVQRAWIQSANFAALFQDGDPIVGLRRPAPGENANDEFTCQALPLRRKYKGLPQFTQLVGGAYFFLPGIKALRFIARHP